MSSVRNFIKKLFRLLEQRSDQKAVARYVYWTLSNITCQNSHSIDLVIGKNEYIKKLVQVDLGDSFEVPF